jgi:Zn-dependent protease with chaperone function
MPAARWVDFVGQEIFHTFVAALVVEALVRLWRVREPQQRLALRLMVLGYSLLVLPAYFLLFPERAGEAFRDFRALFAAARWDEMGLLGVGLYRWWVGLFAAIGLLLFLMDLLPLLWGRRGGIPPESAALSPQAQAASAVLAELSAGMGVARPRLVFLAEGGPALFCAGARNPALVISRSAVDLLDRQELRAAVAHELAHLDRLDPSVSWVLMAGRAAMFFNPAFQVVARAMARDAEWRADERAAAGTGDRLALASGLLKLYRATAGRPPVPGRRNLPLAAALAEPLARARALDIEFRCRRLMQPAPAPVPFGALRLAATAASLSVLLFFVV